MSLKFNYSEYVLFINCNFQIFINYIMKKNQNNINKLAIIRLVL